MWVLLGAVLLTGCLSAAASQADPYGELTHFGEKGTGVGQLEGPEAAFGVNPEDNSLYVVDEVKEGISFRIQKFERVSGKYTAVASATFKPKDPKGEEEDEVQGVAVDPKLGRVYVLSLETRPPLGGTKKRLDQYDGAAGELYAFSTKQNGSKLEFASGTSEGVLTGTEELEPLSNEPGVSLLEPGGLTVDPVDDSILIAGRIDRGKLGETEEEETAVVQQIASNGKLGTRYVDQSNYFEECGCVNSPVVSSSGHIYVLGEEDEIAELPSDLSSATAPKRVFQMPVAANCIEAKCPYVESLTDFPGPGGEGGAQMSIGAEGKIYVRNRIKLASEGNFSFGGVMVLSPAFAELGWTGGGSSTGEACSVNELTFAKPAVAAGKEEVVFMLSRNAKTPKIVEFGPGGGQCPKGTATTPTAKAGGIELERFPMGEKVTFSSTLTQANAVGVEWEFGDGTPMQVVNTREQSTTTIEHKFLKSGKLTVKERIRTDNLSTPLIEKERQVEIIGAPAIRAEETLLSEGASITLKGEVNPNDKKTECRFEYGPAGEAFPTSKKLACPTALGEGDEFMEESARISGLSKGSEYHFRIWAKNSAGEETVGKGTSFSIPAQQPPAVTTSAATAVTQTTATLTGTVNPEGEEASCHFEYGPTTAYGREAACASAPGSGEKAVAVSGSIGGLLPATAYHYRLVAKSSTGTTQGADSTFVTATVPSPPPPPPPPAGGGEQGKGGTLPIITVKPTPAVTIASTSLSVSGAGAFSIKLACPGDETSCAGSVTVRTLTAVAASSGHLAKKKRKAILTLASASFTIAAGQLKALTLHLSAKAKTLLAHSHTLRARVTIAAHDPAGTTHTTVALVTLKEAKRH